uniref:Photosystem I reaction center subunit VIII n=1 Tax=Chlamydomonas leiostraca TaxID=1034604 RepID=A0A7S0R5C6_9CHLO|eukprot:CAMPEP_0202859508 /NCGR_PEP_ID=MMETSP1391-20130828/1583_1 /ASSEMBLY_ACC=CAM_ASM_000867 /TAXON_ID=1034604 /ORGANISM="Chlamydomonas leiostraca, Strain SAG 11-49" /LENGTH=103 /DNA_ID=CAMNT_0049538543 /DNA_START=32 /DNA_END=343 /DNA_ORIENTATION=-
MAMSVRASAVKPAARAGVKRAAVKPVAAVNPKVAAAGVATIAAAAAIVAPAEAANVISTVASAAEGYPFVPPSWAPSLFVPLTGLVLPAVGMAWAFTYIQKTK